ncbi:hypothetical protein [Streptomyces sp. NPDC047976]
MNDGVLGLPLTELTDEVIALPNGHPRRDAFHRNTEIAAPLA